MMARSYRRYVTHKDITDWAAPHKCSTFITRGVTIGGHQFQAKTYEALVWIGGCLTNSASIRINGVVEKQRFDFPTLRAAKMWATRELKKMARV